MTGKIFDKYKYFFLPSPWIQLWLSDSNVLQAQKHGKPESHWDNSFWLYNNQDLIQKCITKYFAWEICPFPINTYAGEGAVAWS